MSRLSVRLTASHVAVALVGGAVTFVVVRWTTPALFDRSVMGMGMMNRGTGQAGQGQLRDAVAGAVTTALIAGIGAALAVALAASLALAGRLLRPVKDVRLAARRIAGGDYSHHVDLPQDRELAALAADVNLLAQRLDETETRRVRLLSEVAHEMRTPLTVLEGRLEGLADGVFEASPEMFTTLANHVGRLHRLADDLSALSRVEEHRLDLTRTDVSIADVVDAAASRFRATATSGGVAIDASHAEPSLHVEADEQRLGQVLDNLIGNALRAMPEGGRLTLGTKRTGDWVVVTVSDTGRGLAREDLERIFERFYRAPRSRPASPAGPAGPADQGTGIGLTVSRGIAEAHGGTLTAESPGPGEGATFVLTLPRFRVDSTSGDGQVSSPQAGP